MGALSLFPNFSLQRDVSPAMRAYAPELGRWAA